MPEASDDRFLIESVVAQARGTAEEQYHFTPKEVECLVHELRSHQIELELQNAQLRDAQQKCSAAHDRYLELYDYAPVGYLTLNDDGHILYANLTSGRLLGISRQTLLQYSLSHFVLPSAQDDYHRFFQRLRHAETLQTVELPMVRAEATPFLAHIDANIAPPSSKDLTKKDIRYLLTLRDGTLWHPLQSMNELLTTILGAVKDGITFSDNEGHFWVFNAEMERLTGYSMEEANACGDFTTLLYPDSSQRQQVIENLAVLRETEKAQQIETTIVTKEGKRRVLLVSSCMVTFQQHQMYLTAYQDITRRKFIEEELLDSNARFQMIFNSSADGLLLYDINKGRLYLANPACLHMLGYTMEEFTELSLVDLISPEDLSFITEQISHVVNLSVGLRAEIRLRRKDGSIFFAGIAQSPLTFGQNDYALVVIRDISLRKEAEQQRAAYQHDLRALMSQLSSVEQHTRQLIAMELHDQIGQVLALTKIQLDSLHAREADSQIKASLRDMGSNIQKALHTVRSLSFELCPPLLVDQGLGEALRWLAGEMGSRHQLTITVHEFQPLPPMDHQLRNMLYWSVRELLVNVVKHARARSVSISMGLTATHIEVNVEDDGCGFSQEPFEGDHSSVSGFGLFSIHEHLRYLGGQIAIDSSPGLGTHIGIRMPIPEWTRED